MWVRLQAEIFSPGAEIEAFVTHHKDAGAVASFYGSVRSTPEHPVRSLHLEHYPPLARKQIETFVKEATERFDLIDAAVIHRFGTLARGEPIVLAMTIAHHRQAALDGVSYIMDWLKTEAPFWKREQGPAGHTWIKAKRSDDDAAARWRPPTAK
ncbi:MAG: molybdenum cofactor biosynthesis protein MoaE [Alphaproteobacteria bacterium]|nr:molybdenum cofactor biosynthesis protein MoaE [Alphaproteobacteria bacterium]